MSDPRWILAELDKYAKKEFAEYAAKATSVSDWQHDRAQGIASVLTYLHGLSDGEFGLSPVEVAAAVRQDQRRAVTQQPPVLDPELTRQIQEELERAGRASAAVLLRGLRDDLSAGQCIAFVRQLSSGDQKAVTR